jgi:hypothetical protein
LLAVDAGPEDDHAVAGPAVGAGGALPAQPHGQPRSDGEHERDQRGDQRHGAGHERRAGQQVPDEDHGPDRRGRRGDQYRVADRADRVPAPVDRHPRRGRGETAHRQQHDRPEIGGGDPDRVQLVAQCRGGDEGGRPAAHVVPDERGPTPPPR